MSQVADKINFNFDQLILNGGGAVGPPGPGGPPGPIGGRGERGSEWYEDPNNSATDPNTIIVSPDLLTGDFYLDFDGNVWEYNGTTWNQTTVNLKGPTGSPGLSQGWSYFGQTPNISVGETSIYMTPMPNASDATSGATASNQGMPTLVVGAVPSTQADANPPAIQFTNAYQISDAMASALQSNVVSMLLHQKNSGTAGIKFMGGGASGFDNYEQTDFTLLASIDSRKDDGISIKIPKVSSNPLSPTDLIGFEVFTTNKGQYYYAGKQIEFFTGTAPGGAVDKANFEITLDGVAPKYMLNVNSGDTTLMEVGSGVSLTPVGTKTGSFFVHTKDTRFQSDGQFKSISTGETALTTTTSNMALSAAAGDIQTTSEFFNLFTTERIKINNDCSGSSPSSIQVIAGNPVATINGFTPGGLLTGSQKINVRAQEDLVLETQNGSLHLSAGMGGSTEAPLMIRSNGGDISIRANDSLQSTNPKRTGNILIRMGSGSGTVYGEFRGGDSSSSSRLTQGQFSIGSAADDNNITGTGSFGLTTLRPNMVIDNQVSSNFIATNLTNTIRIGRRMVHIPGGVSNNYQKFYGGGEIAGPAGFPIATGNRVGSRQVESNEVALHLRSSLDDTGLNPGDVWLYTPKNLNPSPGSADFTGGSVRIWGTDTSNISRCVTQTMGGTTIGLDFDNEKGNRGGDNAVGKISLYGKKDALMMGPSTPVLSQRLYQGPHNDDDVGNSSGTVNIGDRRRGRQKLKVYGDIDGHLSSMPYYSKSSGMERLFPLGGSGAAGALNQNISSIHTQIADVGNTGGRPFWTGPTVQSQQVLSGATGMFKTSSTLQNTRPNGVAGGGYDINVGFRMSMNFQRIGSIVQGMGHVMLKPDYDSISDNGGSYVQPDRLYNWLNNDVSEGGNDPHALHIGPIPMPLSISSEGAIVDNTINVSGTNAPAEGSFGGIDFFATGTSSTFAYANIFGQVTGVLHRNDLSVHPTVDQGEVAFSGTQMTWPNGPSRGYVAAGNVNGPREPFSSTNDTSVINECKYMWLCIEIPRAATGVNAFPAPTTNAQPDYGLAMNKIKFRQSQLTNNRAFVTEGNWTFSFSYSLSPPPSQPYQDLDSCGGGKQSQSL